MKVRSANRFHVPPRRLPSAEEPQDIRWPICGVPAGAGEVDIYIITDRRLPAGREMVRTAARAALAAYSRQWSHAVVMFRNR